MTVFHISVKSRPSKGILGMYTLKKNPESSKYHHMPLPSNDNDALITRISCTHQPILDYVLLEHIDSTWRSFYGFWVYGLLK